MKQKTLFAIFLISLFAFLAEPVISQTYQMQIGTATLSNNQRILSRNWDKFASQFVYFASEMQGAKTITSMAFFKNQGNNLSDIEDVEVYMRHSSASTYTSGSYTFPTDGFTLVYEGDWPNNSISGWMEIELDTWFDYNGEDNLEFLIIKGFQDRLTTVADQPYWRYTNVSPGRLLEGYVNGSTGNITYGYIRSHIPNILIGYTYLDMEVDEYLVEQATTAPVARGGQNFEILKVEIKTTGTDNPLLASDFSFSTSGSDNTDDIENAKLYFTKGSSTFNTDILVDEIANPSGDFTFTNSVSLVPGSNYFWLAYDISPDADLGDVVDGEAFSFNAEGETYEFEEGDPEGSREIINPIEGVITIGKSGDYETLADFLGDLEAVGMAGDTDVLILNDLQVTESVYINPWAGMNDNQYRLTIKPDGNTQRRIYGSITSDGIIVINAAKRVTIDGRYSSTSMPRCLLIENTSTGAGAAVRLISQGAGKGASDVTIRNAHLKAGAATNGSTFCVLSSGPNYGTGSPYAEDSNNMIVENNLMEKAYYGVRAYGAATNNRLSGIEIRGNTFGNANNTETIYYYAVYLYSANGTIIENNTIINNNGYGIWHYYGDNTQVHNNVMESPGTYFFYSPIYLYYCIGSNVTNNDIEGLRYYGIYASLSDGTQFIDNKIHDASYNTTYLYGIYFNASTQQGGTLFQGNQIYDLENIRSNTTYNGAVYGFYITGSTANNNVIRFEGNSVWNLTTNGTDLSSALTYDYFNSAIIRFAGGRNYAFYNNTFIQNSSFGSGNGMATIFFSSVTTPTLIDFRNNLMVNRTGNGSNYIYYGSTNGHYNNLDYNIYDLNNNAKMGFEKPSTTEYSSISDWRSYTGRDANSLAKSIPITYFQGVPRLDGGAFGDSDFISPLILVEKDIDGEIRYSNNNYIGTDILNQNLAIGSLTGIDLCDVTDDQEMTYTTQLTFQDGVPRSTKPVSELPYIFEWFYNGEKIEKGNPLYVMDNNKLTLTHFNEHHNGTYYATAELYGEKKTTNTVSSLVEYPVIVSNVTPTSKLYYGCMGDPGTSFSVNYQGTITDIQWFKKTLNDNNMWVPVEEGVSISSINPDGTRKTTLTVDFEGKSYFDIVGEYKVTVYGTGTECSVAETSETYEIKMDFPIVHSDISITGVEAEEIDAMFICEDAGVMFHIELDENSTIFDIHWQELKSGVWRDINVGKYPTAKSESLYMSNLTLEQTGRYRMRIQGSQYCNQTTYFTPPVEIQVVPYYRMTKQPEPHVLCMDGSFNMWVSAEGAGEITGYRWYKDGAPLDLTKYPSANKSLFEVTGVGLEQNGLYQCEMTVLDCRGEISFMSDPAAVYVTTETEIVQQTRNQLIDLGGSEDLKVVAHARFLPPNHVFDYQWYRYNSASDALIPLSNDMYYTGVHSNILTINNATEAQLTAGDDYYAVEVRGNCGTVMSRPIKLEERPAPEYGLEITRQPIAPEGTCLEESLELSVAAIPTGETKTLSYQWMHNDEALTNGGGIFGARSNTLTISSLNESNNGTYLVVVTDNEGGVKVYSNEVLINSDAKPQFTAEVNKFVVEDLMNSYRIDALEDLGLTGSGPMTYKWYFNDELMVGEIQSSYVIESPSEDNTGFYRVVAENTCGTDEYEFELEVQADGSVSVTETADASGLSVVPNPASDKVKITFTLDAVANAVMTINDATGRTIAEIYNGTATSGTNTVEINVRDYNLSSGLYFFTVRSGWYVETKPVMIVK